MPFRVIGVESGLHPLPGLPLSALMTFCPLAAALLLVRRESGPAAVTALLKRS